MKTLTDKMQSLSPERQERITERANELISEEHNLQSLRKKLGLTQKDIAENMGIGQENISRAEKRDDIKLTTLRHYIEAMGGELSITANIPDHPPINLNL